MASMDELVVSVDSFDNAISLPEYVVAAQIPTDVPCNQR